MAEYDFHFTAEVMDGIFGEVITARGAWDTLGERLDNIEQGTGGDTYTKAEVDTMLAEKVDAEEGKDLSTNDFTNQDKEQITTNKNGIASVANRGSKNLFSVNTVIFSGQGIGEVFPVNIPAGDYMFSCNCSATTLTSHLYFFDKNGTELLHQPFTNNNNKKISITVATQVAFARIDSDVQNTISNIMLCTAEDYAISPKFVPYAPTNRELYEMILALQSGT
jgi:hypothetical protein